MSIETMGAHLIPYNATYFDSFGFKLIPKEIKKIIGNKNILPTSYRIQAYDSIMCGFFV